MRGRQILMESLIAQGVSYIFGNPGTTESPIIDSLLDYPQVSYIEALHEGVAVGAASYYAQASGKTGFVNVHVAPGLGNSIGMMYNALKASAPVVVTAGQQDTRMRLRDPLLGHDLVAMAAPVTKWSVQAERADELSLLLHRAFKVANDPPAGPVFVALPIDVMEQESENEPVAPGTLHRAGPAAPAGVAEAAALLAGAQSPVIVVGDEVARFGAGAEIVTLAEVLGAAMWTEGIRMHASVPSSHPNLRLALGFDALSIRKALEGADVLLLVGGPFFEEVWFSPGSPFPTGAAVIQVETSSQRLAYNYGVKVGLIGDPKATFAALLVDVNGKASAGYREAAARRNEALKSLKDGDAAAQRARAQKRWDNTPISMPRLMADIASALPADAIVVDEAITAGPDLARTLSFSKRGDYFGARGGGIGQALPGALGVKVACPDRPVVAISGDGSSMYAIQALWSAAHYEVGVLLLVMANGRYAVMDGLARAAGAPAAWPAFGSIDIAGMARCLGCPAVNVGTHEQLLETFDEVLPDLANRREPLLIEVAVG